jgi:hypothetical protein
MARLVAAALGLALFAARAHAQPVTTADPKYHGTMTVHRAVGTINNKTFNAILKIGRGASTASGSTLLNWDFQPAAQSNGIFPDQEPIVVAIGEDSFTLDPGKVVRNHKGTVFSYHAKGKLIRGIRMLRLMPDTADANWKISLQVVGVDLSTLNFQDPVCRPMAVIIGDDDGFTGIVLTRPSFTSKKITIPSSCDVGNDWPWINQ